MRINGQQFDPKVFEDGTYTVKISEPDSNLEKVFAGLVPTKTKASSSKTIALK